MKELADIGKEERKIKKELRQERNAQKRADYQDQLKRFDLRRQLKSDDLDLYQKTAQLKLAFDKNQISRDRLNQEMKNSLVDNNYKRIKTDIDNWTLDKEKGGYMSLNDAQKEWGKLEKSALSYAIQQSKILAAIPSLKPMTQSQIAALVTNNLNALRPSFLKRIDKSVRVGNRILSTEELLQRFGPIKSATPAGGGGGRTTYTAGQGAPKKKVG